MEILKCKKSVEKILAETDLQQLIEQMLYEINGNIGFISEETIVIGEIPTHLSRNGEQLKAQVQIRVTIEEDDFLDLPEDVSKSIFDQ